MAHVQTDVIKLYKPSSLIADKIDPQKMFIDNINQLELELSGRSLNVVSYGDLTGDGSTNDATALNVLLGEIGSTQTDLYFPSGTYKLATNVTMPSNVRLIFANGAKLRRASGATITLNCYIDAGLYQILDDDGTGSWSGSLRNSEIYPEWFGAVGDGVTDDKDAIIASLGICSTIYLTIGYVYYISSSIECPNNSYIYGYGKILTNSNTAFTFTGTNLVKKNTLVISHITIESNAESSNYAILIKSADNVYIHNCKSSKISLFKSDKIQSTYADITLDSELNSGIYISNNKCVGGTSCGLAAINIGYSKNTIVSNNDIYNYRHGIQYWGGDSNHNTNGDIINPRWAKDITISNNIIDLNSQNGGGIWGSMGQNIAIGNNVVRNCGDVGIDIEGSFFATIDGNIVTDGHNGCLSTFFYNKGVVFSNNTVTVTNSAYPLFRLYNSSLNHKNKDISLFNNHFECIDGNIGVVDNSNGPAEFIHIKGNTFKNVRVDMSIPTNSGGFNISNNDFTFTVSASFNAIQARSTRVSDEVGSYAKPGIVANNTINSTVSQTEIAIYIFDGDGNLSKRYSILGNFTKGFATDCKVKTQGTNSGIRATFYIKDNHFDGGIFSREHTNSQLYKVILEGNTDSSGYYPTGIPVSGQWDVGQKSYVNAPVAGGYIGHVCTTAGTPGTWKPFGLISE